MKSPSSPHRILVICTQRIGDVLLTIPLIRSIRQVRPTAKNDVLVFKNTQGVVKCNNDTDEYLTISECPSLGEHLQLIARLWRKYDLAVSTLVGDRPTLYAYNARRYRIGRLDALPKNRWNKRLLSSFGPFDNLDPHTLIMNLQLVTALGIPQHPRVVVSWHAEDQPDVPQQITGLVGMHFTVLRVLPKCAYKQRLRQTWIDRADRLQQRDLLVMLSGGNDSNEKAYIEGLMPEMPIGTINLAGQYTLSQVTHS